MTESTTDLLTAQEDYLIDLLGENNDGQDVPRICATAESSEVLDPCENCRQRVSCYGILD